MKALVVGCGLIGSDYGEQSHAGVYAASNRTELIGGVDPDPRRRERFEARWNVPAYESLLDAIETDVPDIASICTPSNVREFEVQVLVDYVKGIWCEKPLAEKVGIGWALVHWCDEAGVALQVNFQRRFDPLHQRAQRIDLGRPVHFYCAFTGDMLRVGCHAIDLYRWFGADSMELDRIPSDGTTIFDVELSGPKGRILLAAMGQQMLYAPTSESLVFPGVKEQRFHELEAGGLAPAMACGLDSLLDHLEKRTPLLCTGDDGLAALRIHEAIA